MGLLGVVMILACSIVGPATLVVELEPDDAMTKLSSAGDALKLVEQDDAVEPCSVDEYDNDDDADDDDQASESTRPRGSSGRVAAAAKEHENGALDAERVECVLPGTARLPNGSSQPDFDCVIGTTLVAARHSADGNAEANRGT